MSALAICMEKDTDTNKISKKKKKLLSDKFISDIAESNFTMTLH